MPVGSAENGVGLWAGQIMLSANYNYQYIDWSHDPVPGEDFDHIGNLVTHVITPSITIGLSNYLNLTIKQAIGMRSMDWMGPENSAHHRDETTLSGFNNADGGVLGNTDVLLKYLFTNTGSDSGSRIFFGLGLTIPSKSVLTKSPYLKDDNEEALEDHRHFSLSDGCYKMNYELQYYIKGSPQVSFLPSFSNMQSFSSQRCAINDISFVTHLVVNFFILKLLELTILDNVYLEK